MHPFFFALKKIIKNKKKAQWETISASGFINSKVSFICKGLIWLQTPPAAEAGAPPSLGSHWAVQPFTRGRVSPAGHDSPHLSRAHRSQTPLTQHAPYSLLAVTTRDSSRTKEKKKKKNLQNEDGIGKVAPRPGVESCSCTIHTASTEHQEPTASSFPFLSFPFLFLFM